MARVKSQKSQKRRKTFVRFLPIYILMLPGLIYLFINNYMPLPGLVIAFKQYNAGKGIYGSPWVGLKNFEYLFTTSDAFVITRNTILYNVAFIVINTTLAIAVAIILSELEGKRKKVYQSAILLPNLLSTVIIGYLVFAFFSVENGFINNTILKALGKDPVSWYSEPKYWPFILTVVNLWKGIGMGSMMYFAALMGIDTSLYEAAEIDGASRFQKMLHISLPHLVPLICIFTIMNAGSLISGNFDLFYVIPRNTSTLYATTDILNTYVYRSLQESSYAIGATTGLIQSVVGMFLVLLSNWIVKKISPDNSMF